MCYVIEQLKSAFLAAVLLLGLASTATADVLDPFQAQFSVSRGGFGLGTATFSLKPWGNDGCLVYHGLAEPRALLSLFVGEIENASYFCPGRGGQLIPEYFRHREAGDEEDTYRLDFDWPTGTVTYHGEKAENGKATFPVPEGAVEPFLLQLAMRTWLAHTEDAQNAGERSFTIVEENDIKRYRLAVNPGGVVKTPTGSYQTTKVTLVDDKDERLILWMAPKLDFLPVRVEHHEKDEPVISLELIEYSQQRARS